MIAAEESTPAPSSGRYGWAALFAAFVFIAATVTRVIVFVISDAARAPGGVVRAFAAGAVFDLLVALWTALPFMIAASFAGRRYAKRGRRVTRRVMLALAFALVVFIAAAEVVFFDEFDGRFNFVAVDYLLFPGEVVTNIWESYPLVWVLLGVGASAAAGVWSVRRWLARFDAAPAVAGRIRALHALGYAVIVASMSLAIGPRFAHVSNDRTLNEIASNGYYTFWQAVLGRDAPYDGWYATRPDSEVFARLHQLVPAPAPVTTTRAHPLNVILVLEESFGSTFVGAIHPRDTLSITPCFDSLVAEGTLLARAYSTGNRTIRAIETTTASIPPLPGISIVRRVQSTNLYTLPALLRSHGYMTEFIYGGHAIFDGMSTYTRANGFDRVVDESDFPKGLFSTAWGVADEAIFDKTIARADSLDATGKPFFALVLTVSNHRPYTYPSGRIPQNPNEHRRTFAVRYADWAIGRFMRAAKTHKFFDHTVFVLMGDHGARVYGAAEIPLPSYEVPILFYGAGVVAGKRINDITSSMDVPPTILGLLGVGDTTKFFGRDVLRAGGPPGRAVMTHNSQLALMRGDRMAVLDLKQAMRSFRIDTSGVLRTVTAPDSVDRNLIEDAIAYYQGADRLYRSGQYHFTGPAKRAP